MERPPLTTLIADCPERSIRGFVVVDTMVGLGRGSADGTSYALGGTRITPDVTLEEVQHLARKMTLKLALAELPIGGAKAGLVCSLPPGPERDTKLKTFGRLVSPIMKGGIYLGTDMGCSYRDRSVIHAGAGYEVRVLERRGVRRGHTLPTSWEELWRHAADATGLGVAHATMRAVDDARLIGRRVVIQGFGIVGKGVARTLSRSGYQIVAVADLHGTVAAADGLDVESIIACTDANGLIDRARLPRGVAQLPEREAWIDVPTDLLVLAANTHAVNERNVGRVSAKLVVEGANMPTSPGALDALTQCGITVVPDIVANIGGAMASALVLSGVAPRELETLDLVAWLFARIESQVSRNVGVVLDRARSAGITPTAAAALLAAERAAAMYAESLNHEASAVQQRGSI
jgi:glutamate dehydrogenase (NAD(P)+)